MYSNVTSGFLTQTVHLRTLPSASHPSSPCFGVFESLIRCQGLEGWQLSDWGILDLDQNPCGPWTPVFPFWDSLHPSKTISPHAWQVRSARCPKELRTPTCGLAVGPASCLSFEEDCLLSRLLLLNSMLFFFFG